VELKTEMARATKIVRPDWPTPNVPYVFTQKRKVFATGVNQMAHGVQIGGAQRRKGIDSTLPAFSKQMPAALNNAKIKRQVAQTSNKPDNSAPFIFLTSLSDNSP
jgi:hypothetical protein